MARVVQAPRRSLLVSGQQPEWVLSILYAGRYWRFGSQPMVVPDDGDVITVGGGLPSVEIGRPISLFSTSPEPRSVPFELFWPDDLAALIEAGHDFGSATGELALIWPSEEWAERVVLLTGEVVGVEYGAAGEAVGFSLESAPADDIALLPTERDRIDSVTWPSAYSEHVGRYYPLVLGQPGRYDSGGSVLLRAGSEALIVERTGSDADTLLICGRRVGAGTVTIYGGNTSSSFPVTHQADGRGRICAVVDVSGAFAALRAATEFYVSWSGGGGIHTRTGTAAIRWIGEAIEYLLDQTSLLVDRGRTAVAVARLRGVEIGGYLDDAVGVYGLLQDELLPLAPVTIVYGPAGLYPVVWDPDAPPVDHLIAGPGVVRDGPVRYARDRRTIENRLRLDYAIDPETGAPLSTLTLDGEPDDGEIYGSPYARDSQLRYGVREAATESRWVWRRASALVLAQRRLRGSAWLQRQVAYRVGLDRAWLEPGAAVEITDAELSWVARRGLVLDVTLAMSIVVVELLIVDDFLR